MKRYTQLVAKSVTYASNGKIKEFHQDYPNISLVTTSRLDQLSFVGLKDMVVLHYYGGGSLPYKIGSWVAQRDVVGSQISISVYKKHR